MRNNKEPRILFYLKESIIVKEPKGGPYGVGYMYYKESQLRGDKSFCFINDIDSEKQKIEKSKSMIRGLIKRCPNWLNSIQRNIRKRRQILALLNDKPKDSGVDFTAFDIIFFHQPIDLFNERINLKDYKGLVVLQSHCPEPSSHEMYAKLTKFVKRTIPHLLKRMEYIDEFAFNRADYIIFPCVDAEDPYRNNWPYFNIIREKLKVKYITTGIMPVSPRRDREAVLSELGIPKSDFVITYVGRHNEVKGFDLLKQIASSILDSCNDVWFISAGKEEPISRLVHARWKEIGWTTDAHSYISAADVFVLPNRETYFDLVMLEILALGKIVIASRTGGNKYFEKQGVKGVFLYNDVDEAIRLVNLIKTLPVSERLELEKSNKQFFINKCQVDSMYNNCKEVLSEVWHETNA